MMSYNYFTSKHTKDFFPVSERHGRCWWWGDWDRNSQYRKCQPALVVLQRKSLVSLLKQWRREPRGSLWWSSTEDKVSEVCTDWIEDISTTFFIFLITRFIVFVNRLRLTFNQLDAVPATRVIWLFKAHIFLPFSVFVTWYLKTNLLLVLAKAKATMSHEMCIFLNTNFVWNRCEKRFLFVAQPSKINKRDWEIERSRTSAVRHDPWHCLWYRIASYHSLGKNVLYVADMSACHARFLERRAQQPEEYNERRKIQCHCVSTAQSVCMFTMLSVLMHSGTWIALTEVLWLRLVAMHGYKCWVFHEWFSFSNDDKLLLLYANNHVK